MLPDSDLLKAEKCSDIKVDFHQCGDISSPSTDFPVITCAYVLCVALLHLQKAAELSNTVM